ncbi:MAG: tetratricopeptide repeat protein [Pseudomonadota bacterium]
MDGPDDHAAPMTPEALLSTAMEAQQAGDLARASQALDDVLEAVPKHPLPLRLRARVALERCEEDALARYDKALRADPGNPDLHLGKAQALELAGDTKGARIVAQQIAAQAPGFIAGLSYLSALYLAAGEADFTAPFSAAASKAPQDPNILAGWVDALAGIERFDEAADIAANARKAFPDEPHFALLEAIHAGSAGE